MEQYGDGVHDDTPSIQDAINYALKNKVGRLIFPNGNYRITKTIEITQDERLFNLELKGYGAPHLIPDLELFSGDYLLKVTSNITDQDQNKMKRYLTIKDIVIGSNNDNDLANCTGVFIEQQQFLNLDNVRIRGFKKSGLILRDIFDSMVHNVRILNCGDIKGENPQNEHYALMLQGDKLDNVNATKFYGLQIERCPLILKIQSKIRHCEFTDCKFEQNADNHTNLSTIFIDGRAGENTFTNCQFVKNTRGGNNDNQYFIESSNATSYSESAQFFVLFNGCMFTCSPKASNTGHWLNVDGATIVNNIFNHCGGNGNGLYAFRLVANNIFKNNKVFITSWNTNTFRLIGKDNLIKDNIISYMAGDNIDSGVFLSADSTQLNIIEGNNIKNNPKDPYAIAGTSLGKMIIRNNLGREKTIISVANGEPVLLYGSDILEINHNNPCTIFQIKFGYHGQKLKVFFKQAGHSINHNPDYIYLKGQTGYTVKANEIIEFLNIDGVWYQQ